MSAARVRVRLLGGFDLSDADGNPLTLQSKRARQLLAFLLTEPGTHQRALVVGTFWPDLPEVARLHLDQTTGRVAITTEEPTSVANTLTGWAIERGIELDGITISRPSLEEVYLQLTRESADE